MKRSLLILLFWTVIGVTNPASAAWTGKGEVVGQVTSSRFLGPSGDSVQFDFVIESQTIEDGPRLRADGNWFVYRGPRKEAVSVGDRLRLRVNSSYYNVGIIVESIEFIADVPGSPLGVPPTTLSLTGLLVVSGFVCGFAVIVFLVARSKKNRKDDEAAA